MQAMEGSKSPSLGIHRTEAAGCGEIGDGRRVKQEAADKSVKIPMRSVDFSLSAMSRHRRELTRN